MKRSIALSLLILFLFNIIGYYFMFLVLDSTNRDSIYTSLSSEKKLVTFRFHKSELKHITFKDEGKEMLLEGEMYDVKSSSMEGDYFVFHCKHDKKETKLLAGLNKNVQYNTDTKSPEKKQDNTSKNPVKDLFCNQNSPTLHSSAEVVYPSAISHLTSYIVPVLPLPPPEVSMA